MDVGLHSLSSHWSTLIDYHKYVFTNLENVQLCYSIYIYEDFSNFC